EPSIPSIGISSSISRARDFNWPFERNSSGSVRTSLSKGRFITRTSGQRVNQVTDSSASFLQRISYWAVEPKWTTSDVGRTLGYNLWDDGVFSLERRTEIVTEVIDEVFHLKNSVAKHRPEEEFAAIRERIARTTKR